MNVCPFRARIIFIVFILALGQSSSEGCSCIGKSDSIESIHPDQLIVSGKIISRELIEVEFYDTTIFPDAPKMFTARYTMLVEKVYSGRRFADTIEIHTGYSDNCGYRFVTGQTYVVFASNLPKRFFKTNKIIKTDICTHTQLYSKELEGRILALKK